MVGNRTQQEIYDPVLEGHGRPLDPWPESVSVVRSNATWPGFCGAFTLDGTFECGLIARH